MENEGNNEGNKEGIMGIGFTKWAVHRNGKDTGIVETDYAWAKTYWKTRTLQSGARYKLVGIH